MTTKKEQEKRAKLEAKIEKTINKLCENKSSKVKPKKWGFTEIGNYYSYHEDY